MRGTSLLLAATLSLAASNVAANAVAPSSVTASADTARLEELAGEVERTERAFAKTMADRDHRAFSGFLSDEAVFFGGPKPLRGKAEVAAGWKRYFEKPGAPFSWEPAEVVVLESGDLALSTGPVRNAEGKQVATFTSIWRLEAPGTWRIVFDKGCDVCETPKP